ncbi:molybdenum cofactor guanylyltransferase [Paenibacillus oenotherae]|uniref:Probable molybdenum cofactor guanylyltransferase n=1 Tax=Paenibacillus oenotherae TaxID=1435645 RepID=A0ABS7D5N6_9BACL|nr:molybdenum cofactor guanylyltransferase [Paenibacillus oenotherae]MBW7475136.1 molybdenum cofactor guanylyltransferase [Paenibacillus oenotherae]
MMRDKGISGIVLAGGQSVRMGTDKALLDINGKPLLQLLVEQLSELCEPVIIAVGDGEREQSYRDALGEWSQRSIFVRDAYPGSGPLAGLHAALSALPEGYAFVTACDMPCLSEPLLRRMIARTEAAGRTAAPSPDTSAEIGIAAAPDVIMTAEQPFHALYHARIAGKLEGLLQEGEYRVMRMLAQLSTEVIPLDEEEEQAFQNLNTPEAYRQFLQRRT